MLFRTLFPTCLLYGSLALATEAASDNASRCVSRTTTVDAPIKEVWQALRKERTTDPKHRRVISASGNDYIIQETFEHLPVVGDAVCVYQEHEIPMRRLEYKMLRSDKLKVFEGVWELTPSEMSNQTIVKLSSRTDCGIKLPFSRNITRDATSKLIEKKLADVTGIVANQKLSSVANRSF